MGQVHPWESQKQPGMHLTAGHMSFNRATFILSAMALSVCLGYVQPKSSGGPALCQSSADQRRLVIISGFLFLSLLGACSAPKFPAATKMDSNSFVIWPK